MLFLSINRDSSKLLFITAYSDGISYFQNEFTLETPSIEILDRLFY